MSTPTTKARRVPIVIRRMRTPSLKPAALATQVQRTQIREILRAPRPQAKLTVGAPNDSYEQEADRVADQVMSMPEPSAQGSAATAQRLEDTELQRRCPQCDGELRRQLPEEPGGEEEEEVGHAKASPGARPEVQGDTESAIRSLRGGGEPLAPAQHEFFESRFGHDFGGVRVHANTQAAELARAVNARAFTLGSDVVFGSGQYAPETQAGRRLLAHELTHVVQQRRRIHRRAIGEPGSRFVPGSAARRQHAEVRHILRGSDAHGLLTAGSPKDANYVRSDPTIHRAPSPGGKCLATGYIYIRHDGSIKENISKHSMSSVSTIEVMIALRIRKPYRFEFLPHNNFLPHAFTLDPKRTAQTVKVLNLKVKRVSAVVLINNASRGFFFDIC